MQHARLGISSCITMPAVNNVVQKFILWHDLLLSSDGTLSLYLVILFALLLILTSGTVTPRVNGITRVDLRPATFPLFRRFFHVYKVKFRRDNRDGHGAKGPPRWA